MVELKTSIGAFEAKTHFSDLLTRVERGDRILITRHGRAVAVLAPIAPQVPKDLIARAQRALEATKGTSLPKGKTIKDLINEGRKR
jgi:prevent-host-death family protein